VEAVADSTHERPADPFEWNGHDFVRNRFDTAEADRAPAQLSARKRASRKRIKQSRPGMSHPYPHSPFGPRKVAAQPL
jgi:hypothetical protein